MLQGVRTPVGQIFPGVGMTDTVALNKKIQEVWGKVPEEERRELKTFAQSKGAETCAVALACATVVAVAMKSPLLFFGAVGCAPLLFQVVTTKFWRSLKPRLTLRYYVASTTAMTYAQRLKVKEPSLSLIFTGSLSPQKSAEQLLVDEQAAAPRAVWVAVFPELILIFAEGDSGATIVFSHETGADLSVSFETDDDAVGTERRLLIEGSKANGSERQWILTSRYSESLTSCERKVRVFNERAIQKAAEVETAALESLVHTPLPALEHTSSPPA